MKTRVLAILMALTLGVTGLFGASINSYAQEDDSIDVDWSVLLTDSAIVGYAVAQTRGTYLAAGDSIINKISSTTVGAGGSTTAAKRCTVRVTSILERYTGSGWARVTSWTDTETNAYTATVSKSKSVATGYPYRVRSSHYASSDSSSSCTSNLRM